MAASLERREIWFEGRVQGVGFRYKTSRLAAGFEVNGYVRNLPDGRVHLVMEGSSSETQGLMAAIQDAMSDNIDEIEQTKATLTNEFHGFEVRC